MPLKLPPLTSIEIELIERWVASGAKFDGPSESETLLSSLVDPLRNLPAVAPSIPPVEPVTSLVFTPDGASILAAAGRSIRRIDVTTGTKQVFASRPSPINVLLLADDGQTVVAAGGRPGMGGEISGWDLKSGALRFELNGHSDAILAAALSQGGKLLATSGFDRTVIVWDIASRRLLRSLADHTDAVTAVAFSPDGTLLASGGADRTIRLWSIPSGTKIDTLSDSTGEISALAFSSDGRSLFGAGFDRMIRAWSIEGKAATFRTSVFAHQAPVLRLAFETSPHGSWIVSAGEDREVRLWDPASLQPRPLRLEQSEWPQSLALDASRQRLAIGRQDGTVALIDLERGLLTSTFTASLDPPSKPATPPPKPSLFRNATLNPPSPRGGVRGSTLKLTLTGQSVGRATEILLPEPGISASLIPDPKPDANRATVELKIAADARVGVHRIGVVTPNGIPPLVSFAVEAHSESPEHEPNDSPSEAKPTSIPAVITGTIEKPGDLDVFRIELKASQTIVAQSSARSLGSSIQARITLVEADGKIVGESAVEPSSGEALMVYRASKAGPFFLCVADRDFGGSPAHFYRISVGDDPHVADVFPLALSRGSSRSLHLRSENLGVAETVRVQAPQELPGGTVIPVTITSSPSALVLGQPRVVIADGPQLVEEEQPAQSPPLSVAVPGGVSGRIRRMGEVDAYRFEARRGQRVMIEVFGQRLGRPIDPVVEVVNLSGQPVPRAVLRVVAETEVAFRDHDASKPGIRLTRWNQLQVNDTVVIGREVTRIFALPRNPDDDCLFWSEQGKRIGVLETTPEHHPMGQPIWKVDVLPPDASIATQGQPPIVLPFRNDDGGPALGRDSCLTFDPPADGTYEVRVTDAQGLGGPAFSYHLVIRKPLPDFVVSLGTENPNVPRGSTLLVPVSITRRDGYNDAVEVAAVGLPPGIRTTPALIEPGAFTASLALTADADAAAFHPPGWSIRARQVPSDQGHGSVIEHTIDPGGAQGGRITVIPPGNLTVEPDTSRVVLKPGQSTRLTLNVKRGPGFAGRVPIDVRNLPQGVRVLDVGLNGVLVTEAQSARTIVLYAEPWALAMERPFYAVGKAESAGTENASRPVMLVVEGPPAPTQSAARSSR
ncbi:MAG: WD40 repeat domain-containing protein [Isosphaeraceae bacterium]